MSSGLVVHLKLKYFLMKPTHDDIIEAKEVYNKLSFEKYRKREVNVAYLKSSNCHELLGILLPRVGSCRPCFSSSVSSNKLFETC